MYEPYENEHRPVENRQSYSYNFTPDPGSQSPQPHSPEKSTAAQAKPLPCFWPARWLAAQPAPAARC